MQVNGGLFGPALTPRTAARAAVGAGLLWLSVGWQPAAHAATLEEAAAAALDTHPRVSAAAARSSAAKHELRQARGGYFPSIDATGAVGREESNIKSLRATGLDNRYLTRREFGLKLKQLVFDGFGTQSSVERFGALSSAAENDLGDTREEIAFQAVEAYVEVLRLRRLTELAQENVEAHEEAVRKVREKVSLTGNADLHQAEARLSLAISTHAARAGRLREAASRYRRVVGELPGDLVLPNRSPSRAVVEGRLDASQLARSIDEAVREAMDHHPAIKSAQFSVEAASAAAKGARAGYFPKVDLEVSMNRDANLSGIEGVRNSNAVMLVSSWNLFRGGSDQAGAKARADEREAAKQLLADVRREVEEQVAIAVQAKATSTGRLVPLEAHVEAAQKTLTAYEAQQTLGRRSLLDTLNAANELFTARSNLASGLHADLLNEYFVAAAKGRLLDRLGLDTAGQ